jgi:glycerol-3-phosphate dehydrogenase
VNIFSADSRSPQLQQLGEISFDVIVIGGGITGAGIALDATSRGLKVCLIEMQDFAAGTSSRSTKLIHGGLRYLKQFEFRLVSEVGREREIIHRNAPHIVKPERLLLPITKSGSPGKFLMRLGMRLYEFLTHVRKNERHRFLDLTALTLIEPLLKKSDLAGGILYYEYRTDDSRLTLSILKEAVCRGASAFNYLKAVAFTYDSGKVSGVTAEDQITNKLYKLKADHVINASGPWVDELDCLDDQSHGRKLQLTKGVHLVVDHNKLPVKQSVYLNAYDGRMIFVIPREGKTYIGTTDTFYTGNKNEPPVTDEDRGYLLKCVNDFFAGCSLSRSDVESSWAGIRPLISKPGKKPSEISRKDEIFEWDSGLITIAGGKLTGYRKMAQRVVDIVAARISGTENSVRSGREWVNRRKSRILQACNTHNIALPGSKNRSHGEFLQTAAAIGITQEQVNKLLGRHGSETEEIFRIASVLLNGKTASSLPLAVHAELIYAIDNEMCLTPCDFFMRRTGMLYFDIAAVREFAPAVIKVMTEKFNWDRSDENRYQKELEQAIVSAA